MWLLACATVISTILATVALLALFRRLPADGRALVAVCTCGLVFNAVICATFSGVADRYQGRVIWLLPLLVLFLMPAAAHRLRQRKVP